MTCCGMDHVATTEGSAAPDELGGAGGLVSPEPVAWRAGGAGGAGRGGASRRAPAAQVAGPAALLAVADGQSYTAAARRVGRRDSDTVARWVAGFNRDGPGATLPRHGGGPPIRYADD